MDTSGFASLNSPVFVGNPRAPTQSVADDDTSIANTQFVARAIANVVIPGDVDLSNYAQLNSPVLTGNPRAPDRSAADYDTSIANTRFVQDRLAALVASAPGTLNTLNELADALGDDPNFATTIMGLLGAKAPIDSPVLTGNPRAPDRSAADYDTSIANTRFVQDRLAALVASAPGTLNTLNELADALGDDPNFATTIMGLLGAKAPIDSPVLTGNPRAVSRTGSDDDTSIATTAFTQDAIDRRFLIITAEPTQADIDSIPDGGIILVRSTTPYSP